jgi:hypothetical protein
MNAGDLTGAADTAQVELGAPRTRSRDSRASPA